VTGYIIKHASILFACLLVSVNVATRAEPVITTISPQHLDAGKQGEITVHVNDWQTDDAIALSPGGPYLKHTLHLEGKINDIAAAGHYIYAASDDHGLLIIDITHPSEPILVGHWDLSNRLIRLAIAGSRIFAAERSIIHR
jgi:hypothetical protein